MAQVPDAHWVAVMPRSKIDVGGAIDINDSIAGLRQSMVTGPMRVGEPAAVGRLRASGLIDRLVSSIPKEKKEAEDVLGLAIDQLIIEWLRQLDERRDDDALAFECLRASATPFTARLLERRGFSEIEKVDFSAMGRGEPIATHSARLPAAVLAYSCRLDAADSDPFDRRMVEEILAALRSQAPPAPSDELDAAAGAADAVAGANAETDRWAAIRKLAGYGGDGAAGAAERQAGEQSPAVADEEEGGVAGVEDGGAVGTSAQSEPEAAPEPSAPAGFEWGGLY